MLSMFDELVLCSCVCCFGLDACLHSMSNCRLTEVYHIMWGGFGHAWHNPRHIPSRPHLNLRLAHGCARAFSCIRWVCISFSLCDLPCVMRFCFAISHCRLFTSGPLMCKHSAVALRKIIEIRKRMSFVCSFDVSS
jgi:hypothetical protein